MSVSLNVAAEIERGAAEVRGMEIQVGWMYDALGCRLIRPFTRCFYLSAIPLRSCFEQTLRQARHLQRRPLLNFTPNCLSAFIDASTVPVSHRFPGDHRRRRPAVEPGFDCSKWGGNN